MTDQEVHQHVHPDVASFHRTHRSRVTDGRPWHLPDQVEDPIVVKDAQHVPGQHLWCEAAPLVWLQAGAHSGHPAFFHQVVCHPDRPPSPNRDPAQRGTRSALDRSLCSHTDLRERSPNFEDEVGEGTIVELPGVLPGTNWERLRAEARAYLRDHEDHLGLQRLRRNHQLTLDDLTALEGILLESGAGTEADIAPAREVARLYESPFTDNAPQGPDMIFAEEQVDGIVAILAKVRWHALPTVSLEEIQRLRGKGAPPGLPEDGLAAFRYVQSPSMKAAVADDQEHREKSGEDMRLASSRSGPRSTVPAALSNTSTGNCGAALGPGARRTRTPAWRAMSPFHTSPRGSCPNSRRSPRRSLSRADV